MHWSSYTTSPHPHYGLSLSRGLRDKLLQSKIESLQVIFLSGDSMFSYFAIFHLHNMSSRGSCWGDNIAWCWLIIGWSGVGWSLAVSASELFCIRFPSLWKCLCKASELLRKWLLDSGKAINHYKVSLTIQVEQIKFPKDAVAVVM